MFLCFDNHISKHWRLCRLYVRRADTNGFINIYSSTLSNPLVNLNLQVTKREGEESEKMIFKYCSGGATSERSQKPPSKVGRSPGCFPGLPQPSLPGGGLLRADGEWRPPVLEKQCNAQERAQLDLFRGWG